MNNTNGRYMLFRLSNQNYAIPLLTVREVIPRTDIIPVPNMPQHFEGMLNLRGQILGVFNIKKKLGTKTLEGTAIDQVIIVIEENGVSVGMIVDEVTKVIHAAPEAIGPAPLKDNDPARNYVSAIIQHDEDLIMIMQAGRLLELDKYKNVS